MNLDMLKQRLKATQPKRKYDGDDVVAVLHGGDTLIIVVDHCYSILDWNGFDWRSSSWINFDVCKALKELPDCTDYAKLYSYNELIRINKMKEL
jgi:hypothetical protein